MSLREADSYGYLRLKEQIESRPTNSNAVYQDGKVRPVFIYTLNGKDVFVVEGDDYKFYPAQKSPGSAFVRWEAKPEPPQVVEPPSQPERPKFSSWEEERAYAEAQHRKALAEENVRRLERQGITVAEVRKQEAFYNQEAEERETARLKHLGSRI
jgi:hypothetical protein